MASNLTKLLSVLAIGVTFLLVSCLKDENWVTYTQIKPTFAQCRDVADAHTQALLYMQAHNGLEVNTIPASFSMSRTFEVNDWYVIESLPFEQAGGHAAVFWEDDTHRRRIIHYLVARDANGDYISWGDGPRNNTEDSQRVNPARYIGVVNHAFTFPR